MSIGPHPLLWNGPRAARGTRIIIYVPNRLNCCAIFTVYTLFTKAATGRIIQHGGLRVESHDLIHVVYRLSMNKPFSAILIIADRVLNWSKVYKTRKVLSFRNKT